MMFILFTLFALVFACNATSQPGEAGEVPCAMPMIALPPECHFKDEVRANGCPTYEMECPLPPGEIPEVPCPMPMIALPPECHFKDEVRADGCPTYEIECPLQPANGEVTDE